MMKLRKLGKCVLITLNAILMLVLILIASHVIFKNYTEHKISMFLGAKCITGSIDYTLHL